MIDGALEIMLDAVDPNKDLVDVQALEWISDLHGHLEADRFRRPVEILGWIFHPGKFWITDNCLKPH